METLDFKQFIAQIDPFSSLNEPALREILKHVDIHYYADRENILKKGEVPTHYHIIGKGAVQECDEGQNLSLYVSKDSFDAGSTLSGKSRADFISYGETICFEIKADAFKHLIETNPVFESYYLHNISEKMQMLLKKEINEEFAFFMTTRVRDCLAHTPVFVPSSMSILESIRIMSEKRSDFLLVEFENRHSMVTNSDLRDKVLLPGRLTSDAIGSIATEALISIDGGDFLFNALLTMIEHSIQRVAITEEGQVTGVIEQVDLLAAISSKAHMASFMIDKANSVEELQEASSDIIQLIKNLQMQGVKVRYITKLLAELNTKLYHRLFTLLAPQELMENSCLIVLGSEGRREQTLRTDQDNALILRDGYAHPELPHIMQSFTEALLSFGFPPCEGNIMVSNPDYCKELKKYDQELFEMLQNPTGEHIIKIAILFDARHVSGDAELLHSLKHRLYDYLQDDVGFYAHFAKATEIFETPLSLFSSFIVEKKSHKDELDIKKGGIFPIMHGIRSLALEMQCESTSTTERIKELNNRGILEWDFSKELIEGYTFLLSLRLNHQLQSYELGKPVDNYINPKDLSKFERDILRDVFKIVDRFKKLIAHHFRLNMVS